MREPRTIAAALLLLTLAAATATPPHPTTVPQLCTAAATGLQQCSTPVEGCPKKNACCRAMSWLQDLGCFCLSTTKESTRSALSPDAWAALPLCGMQLSFDTCDSKPAAMFVPTIPGVLSVPGKGLVQVSTILSDLEGTPAQQLGSHPVQDLFAAAGEVALDTRPVLDLSLIPDDITVIFDTEDELDVDLLVVMEEPKEQPEEMVINLDFPMAFGDEEFEFDLESVSSGDLVSQVQEDAAKQWDTEIMFELETDGASEVDFIVSSDLFDEAVAISQSLAGLGALDFVDGLGVSDDEAVRQLAEAWRYSREELTVEVELELPEGVMQSLGASDVVIEMDVDFSSGETISETAISVENDGLGFPMSGQGLGNLLIEAAEWLSAFLPMPLTEDFGESARDDERALGMLGGALKLLTDIGEEISDKIPNQPLHSGDTIEVLLDEDATSEASLSDSLRWRLEGDAANNIARLSSRRAMDPLALAVSSALYSKQAEQKVQRQVTCTICEVVHQHARLLWGVICVNATLLTICCILAVYRAVSSRAPTLPAADSDLRQSLIVNAADFAADNDEFALLKSASFEGEQALVWEPKRGLISAPLWEPATKGPQ